MVVIGFLANKKCGKSTSADYLCKKYGFIERSFAHPLKHALQSIFLLDDDQLYGGSKEIVDDRWYGCTPRKMLQYVGTDLLRNQLSLIMPGIDNGVFIHHFRLWYLAKCQDENINVTISDVRFQNEVDMIHELGGIVVKINRDICEKTDNHSSEQINDVTYDVMINNDSSLDNLYTQLDYMISEKNNCNVIPDVVLESIPDIVSNEKLHDNVAISDVIPIQSLNTTPDEVDVTSIRSLNTTPDEVDVASNKKINQQLPRQSTTCHMM